jgi:lysozyme family protein
MADYAELIPWIKSWEGGLSSAVTDYASAYPVPDGSGNHTNKGITWQTWSSYFGSSPSSIARFYAMSDADWAYIYKTGYWDRIQGDLINSQKIANTLADWAWGSGPGAAIMGLQAVLGNVAVDGRMDKDGETLRAVNKANADNLYSKLVDYRRKYIEAINQPANTQGWLNRLDSLVQFNGAAGGLSLGLVLALFAGWFLWRKSF